MELPILLVAIFKYNSLNFDKRLSSTLYLVGFACTSSIIASVLYRRWRATAMKNMASPSPT